MIGLKVKIDVAAALAALDAVEARRVEKAITNKVADEIILPRLAKYPSPSGKKMQFVSERQRRFVMASIRSGAITVPYHRSGALGRSWVKQPLNGGMAIISRLAYAPYVVGDGEQAAYHRGTWDTLTAISEEIDDDVSQAATASVVELIGDAA